MWTVLIPTRVSVHPDTLDRTASSVSMNATPIRALMAPLAAIGWAPICAIVLTASLERDAKISWTGVPWVESHILDLNCYLANLAKGRVSTEPLANKSTRRTSVHAHLVGRESSATWKWYRVKTPLFAKDLPFRNSAAMVASVKTLATAIVASVLKVTRAVIANTRSTSAIRLLARMEPRVKISLAHTRAYVQLVSRVPIASITSTTAIQIHVRMGASATIWSTPFRVPVRTARSASFVKSTSMNATKELAITEVPVSTRSAPSNANVHLVSLDRVAKVTSMNVYLTRARLLEPSTASSWSIITVAIASRATWDDTASSKSIFAKHRRATMEAYASMVNWVILASALLVSLARIAIQTPSVIPHLAKMEERVVLISKDSSALAH